MPTWDLSPDDLVPGRVSFAAVPRTDPSPNIIRTIIHDKHPGSKKITAHLDHIRHCKATPRKHLSNSPGRQGKACEQGRGEKEGRTGGAGQDMEREKKGAE